MLLFEKKSHADFDDLSDSDNFKEVSVSIAIHFLYGKFIFESI